MTGDDINRAEHIYEEATPTIQGKMRRKKSTVHSKIEKKTFTSSSNRETKIYISIHGHFNITIFIFLHSKT